MKYSSAVSPSRKLDRIGRSMIRPDGSAINPRIPAWVYLAVGAGQNLPEALLKLALDMEVKPFEDYQVGKMFIRYSYDLITDLKEFEKLSTMGEL